MEKYLQLTDLHFEHDFMMLQLQLVRESRRYIGAPTVRYRSKDQGMSLEDGFDCSGFIKFLLNKQNIFVAEGIRHSDEFFRLFGEFIHDGRQRGGDLVFFSGNGIFPTHMGIMVSSSIYIHAPTSHDSHEVRIDHIKTSSIPIHKEYASKQIYTINPIGYKRIVVSELRLPVR